MWGGYEPRVPMEAQVVECGEPEDSKGVEWCCALPGFQAVPAALLPLKAQHASKRPVPTNAVDANTNNVADKM